MGPAYREATAGSQTGAAACARRYNLGMPIDTDGAGRPKPAKDTDRAKEARAKRARLLRKRESEAQATGPLAVDGPSVVGVLERDDALLDHAEDWYLKGVTRPRELAKLLKEDPDFVRDEVIPAVLRRLSAEKSPHERRAATGEAVGRYRLMLKYAWSQLHRAGKPSVQAQWSQVIMNANRELDKLSGASTDAIDAKALQLAVNAFVERVVQIAESTNDPALMHRIEEALGTLVQNQGAPMEAEFTEIPQG